MLSRIGLIGAAALVAGCTGTVVMTPLDPATIQADYASGKDTNGIIVYRAEPLMEVDTLTQANVVPDPSKPGNSIVSDDCTPVLARKPTTIADINHPYRLHYEHGILETYTFGATLTPDGVLTVINSQSTPDQGKTLQNLASTASVIAPLTHGLTTKSSRPCTITPVFKEFERLPTDADIKPYSPP